MQIFDTAKEKKQILVWDAPVRVFHWLLALSFAGAYVSAESDRWLALHVTLGYTMAGLVAFRILWGLVGTRYARFGSFVRGPLTLVRYGRAMLAGRPEHHVGHNPAGAVAIMLLLSLSIAIVATGWLFYSVPGARWLKELHEGAAGFMLAVVGLHIGAAVLTSLMQRENLVRAMVNGKKAGAPNQGIRRAWRPLALVMVAAVLGFWYLQWQSPATLGFSDKGLASQDAKYRSHTHDDD